MGQAGYSARHAIVTTSTPAHTIEKRQDFGFRLFFLWVQPSSQVAVEYGELKQMRGQGRLVPAPPRPRSTLRSFPSFSLALQHPSCFVIKPNPTSTFSPPFYLPILRLLASRNS